MQSNWEFGNSMDWVWIGNEMGMGWVFGNGKFIKYQISYKD